jgi:hypothetical protein
MPFVGFLTKNAGIFVGVFTWAYWIAFQFAIVSIQHVTKAQMCICVDVPIITVLLGVLVNRNSAYNYQYQYYVGGIKPGILINRSHWTYCANDFMLSFEIFK